MKADRRSQAGWVMDRVMDRRTFGLGLAGAAMWPAIAARAQALADNSIKIWVGAPAGGTTDTMARLLAPALAQELGQVVVVDNRAGAGGNLAAETVARSSPDGRNLLMSFTSHTINASLFPSLPFDPVKDFTPISRVSTSPSVLVAHPSVPARDVAELIPLAKAKPGRLNFAIGALGSSLHLAGEAFKMKAGVNIVNVPYRGTAPAVQDVLAGQVELMFAAVGNVLAHIKSGRLRALGVTSTQRLALLPEVPTLAETLPGFESSAWFGLLGPARMQPELVNKLNRAVHQALRRDDIRKFIESEGAVPAPNTPAEFARFVQADVLRWREVVKFSGARPE
jgi:tripartite-type tricarboxylate transporter receptor subunit TctC